VTGEPFDPFRDLFVAQSARPAQLEGVNLRALTPFQRALLVIDGTVTKFIEAYTMEPVETLRLGQERRSLSSDHPWLEAPGGTEVIARQVVLEGVYSRSLYAYATSLVVPDRLPAAIRADLDDANGSLGRILLDRRLETRRDILWYGRERLADPPAALRRYPEGEFLSRTYRIIAGGAPIMLIHEKFPVEPDRFPSQI
jgi:chorismate-pyruvate lyase